MEPSTGHTQSAGDRALIVRAAKQFYLQDRSKVQIAQDLGISRFKVARLLEEGRELGIVQISIEDRGLVDEQRSRKLAAVLGLDRAIVVEADKDPDEARNDVGGAAAALLAETLKRGETLGMGWGRTISATAEKITHLPEVSVVQLSGATEMTRHLSPVEVVRTISRHAGGQVAPIFAPLIVDSPGTAAALRRQPDIQRAFAQFDTVTTAVMAVGSWLVGTASQLYMSLESELRKQLLATGVIGEIGVTLVGQDGGEIYPELADRCIAVTAAQLRAIPRVVAVAAGRTKATAVAAIAQGGLITELVTDRELADAVLEVFE